MSAKPYTDAELVNLAIRADKGWPLQSPAVIKRLVAELQQARKESDRLRGVLALTADEMEQLGRQATAKVIRERAGCKKVSPCPSTN